MRPRSREQGPGALEVIEEATHLLRRAPGSVIAAYFAGSLPFVLGFLYFWSDMSRSAYADDRCAPAALGLAVLFVWMKTWQGVFARQLRAILGGAPVPRWTLRRTGRLVTAQAFLQPTGLVLLPLAFVATLPFGWVFAAYQSLTAQSDGASGSARSACRRALAQAALWPRQNHIVLLVLFLFGLFVFLNVLSVFLVAPQLLKTLLGVETTFTRSPWSAFNTTLLASAAGVSYLCFDPLVKAAYALRVYYGESLRTGEDLLARLEPFQAASRPEARTENRVARKTVIGLLGFLCISGTLSAAPETSEPPPPAPRSTVSGPDLDRAITQVMGRSEYAWRLPRDRASADEVERGWIAKLLDSLHNTIRQGLQWIDRTLGKVWAWLRKALFGGEDDLEAGTGAGWVALQRGLLWLLIVLAACILGALAWRVWKGRARSVEVSALPLSAAPDVAREDLSASQLPEDAWLTLARDLLAKGEARLALRALYLASLARLAGLGLISIARFKSNHDYERELRRRAHTLPDLLSAFSQNVAAFERVWYGIHAATDEAISRFTANLERIRAS